MRRAARTDTNHTTIVDALRSMGCTVQSLAAVGKGCPDLLVGYSGKNYLLEIKDGKKPPSKRALTPDQTAWHRAWRGHVAVVCSVDEALDVIWNDANK